MIEWDDYATGAQGYIGDKFVCTIWYPATIRNSANYYVTHMDGTSFRFDTLDEAKAAAELIL